MKRSLTVICHFNGKEMLGDCLRALKDELGERDDVLVVDNGSSDGSATYLKKEFTWVKLLELPENLGFAGGNNQALKFVDDYEYFVLLNNDIEVEPGFLESLLAPFSGHPERSGAQSKNLNPVPDSSTPGPSEDVSGAQNDSRGIGITNAVILDADGKTVDHAGGQWLNFLSGTNVGGLRGIAPAELPTQTFETTYASGAALAIPTTILKQYGLFPDFFAYYEDVDLSWRVRNAGYRIIVAPKSRVCHLGSATSGKNRPLFEFFAARNRIWLFRRNLPAWQKPIALPILVVARLLLLLPSIGNREILTARTKGLWSGIVDKVPRTSLQDPNK